MEVISTIQTGPRYYIGTAPPSMHAMFPLDPNFRHSVGEDWSFLCEAEGVRRLAPREDAMTTRNTTESVRVQSWDT